MVAMDAKIPIPEDTQPCFAGHLLEKHIPAKTRKKNQSTTGLKWKPSAFIQRNYYYAV